MIDQLQAATTILRLGSSSLDSELLLLLSLLLLLLVVCMVPEFSFFPVESNLISLVDRSCCCCSTQRLQPQ